MLVWLIIPHNYLRYVLLVTQQLLTTSHMSEQKNERETAHGTD